MIESAVAVPRQAFGGHLLHTTVHEVAAAYLFHLVSNHGFEDGNKRVGTFAALTFLNMNGYKLTATGTELEALVRGVAAGRRGKSAVIAFFASCTAPRLD